MEDRRAPAAESIPSGVRHKKGAAGLVAQFAALRSAPSMESVDSAATFDGSCYGYAGPQATDNRPTEAESDYSSCASKRPCDWDSPTKDIDLTASEDILCDDLDEGGPLAYSQTSSCSNLSEGHFIPRPVPPYCLVSKTAEQYGFTPFVISVGTSYFQRLASIDPQLKKAAQGCPDFAPFVRDVPDSARRLRKSVGAPLHQCQTPRHWLLAVHLTCIYIAAKNVEVVPYVHLLQTMLQCLHGLIVTQGQAEALELEVLLALEWRLGPFFLHHEE